MLSFRFFFRFRFFCNLGKLKHSKIYFCVFWVHTVPHFHCICVAQECEDLKKENKYLSSEIHMERIMMRTESELTMRNMRNLNQELQAHVKEVCTHYTSGIIVNAEEQNCCCSRNGNTSQLVKMSMYECIMYQDIMYEWELSFFQKDFVNVFNVILVQCLK